MPLARVMALVNAEQLQSAFAEWMKSCHDLTDGAVVAIDGKTLRGSYCRGKGKGAIPPSVSLVVQLAILPESTSEWAA